MRKLIVVCALIGTFVFSAKANVWVAWSAGSGFYWTADSGSGILSPGESALAQLIWTPDNFISDAVAATPGFVSGNETVLASIILPNDGSLGAEWAYFGAQIHDDNGLVAGAPSSGYIYARIFENADPQVDDWYYRGDLLPVVDKDPPIGQPQEYFLNRDDINGDAIDGTYGAQVVVPEPASISLLVLGAAVLGLRRRRR